MSNEPPILIENGTLICPHNDCGATNQIIELDVASRDNKLSISDDGTITAHLGDHTFEHDGFECQQCARPVSLPDGSHIDHA